MISIITSGSAEALWNVLMHRASDINISEAELKQH